MSRQMSSFVKSVQRKFNDYTSYTESLIYDFTNNCIQEFETQYHWPSMYTNTQFYNTANEANKYLSSYTTVDHRVSGIHKIYDDTNKLPLTYLSLERYLDLGLTEETAQYATHYVPFGDKQIKLYPIPSTSATYTIHDYVRHPYMSAGSQYFSFADDEVDLLRNKVIADVMEDKDDSRMQIYMRRYVQGVKQKRRQLKLGEGQNQRLQAGNAAE